MSSEALPVAFDTNAMLHQTMPNASGLIQPTTHPGIQMQAKGGCSDPPWSSDAISAQTSNPGEQAYHRSPVDVFPRHLPCKDPNTNDSRKHLHCCIPLALKLAENLPFEPWPGTKSESVRPSKNGIFSFLANALQRTPPKIRGTVLKILQKGANDHLWTTIIYMENTEWHCYCCPKRQFDSKKNVIEHLKGRYLIRDYKCRYWYVCPNIQIFCLILTTSPKFLLFYHRQWT